MSPMIVNPFRFGGGGGGPSLPVAGAELWLRCDAGIYESTDTSDPAEDGDMVRCWADQSGNGHLLVDATNAGPARDSGEQHLSRDTLRFAAASARFLPWPNSMFSGLTAGEVFVTKKHVADPAASTGSSGLWTLNAGSSFHTHHPYTDGVIYDNTFTNVRKTVGDVTPPLTNWHVYSVRSDSGDWEAYIDNTSVFSTGTNTVEFPGGANLAFLGRSWDGTYSLDGWIAELVFFPFTLNSTERGDMYSYLSTGS